MQPRTVFSFALDVVVVLVVVVLVVLCEVLGLALWSLVELLWLLLALGVLELLWLLLGLASGLELCALGAAELFGLFAGFCALGELWSGVAVVDELDELVFWASAIATANTGTVSETSIFLYMWFSPYGPRYKNSSEVGCRLVIFEFPALVFFESCCPELLALRGTP